MCTKMVILIKTINKINVMNVIKIERKHDRMFIVVFVQKMMTYVRSPSASTTAATQSTNKQNKNNIFLILTD